VSEKVITIIKRLAMIPGETSPSPIGGSAARSLVIRASKSPMRIRSHWPIVIELGTPLVTSFLAPNGGFASNLT